MTTKVIRETREESIFTTASVGGVPLSAQDTEAAEESMTVQESRRNLKEYVGGFSARAIREMPEYQQFLDFITTRNLPGIHPSDVKSRWETMFGPMNRTMLRPLIDTLQADGVLDAPMYESKKKDKIMKYPFTQTKLDENRVLRHFSKNLTEGELAWHRDREHRIVRMVEGNGWYLQLDNKLPKSMRLGEVYQIPAGSWHRLIRRPNASNLTVVIEKKAMKKGDKVTHKGKSATVKIPDARGPFVGIDPAGPDDMKMVPGDELDEPKKGKKNESTRVEGLMDEALDDLLGDVLHEKRTRKIGRR